MATPLETISKNAEVHAQARNLLAERVTALTDAQAALRRERAESARAANDRAKAAALNHETGDNAVKNGVGVKAVIHILQKIGNGFGGLVSKKLHQNVAGGGLQQNRRIVGHGCSLSSYSHSGV